ncbi:MAG: putative hydro-lyase [bacterium]|nr:putative hydro-lyase [bacterium]
MTRDEVIRRIRSGEMTGTTSGLCPEYVQANLVIVPAEYAPDVRGLCMRNPVPCPLVEELPAGTAEPRCAPGSDLRTDLPGYRLWKNGELAERRHDIRDLWRDDLVSFLIGCSFTFERALVDAGYPLRHQQLGTTVPMYRTNVPLAPAGRLHGRMVVSMRVFRAQDVEGVRDVTRGYVEGHGEPVHWGDPAKIGIADVAKPDEGDPLPIEPGEVPVFWGCGVTPQLVTVESRLPFVITHEPGSMFITALHHGDSALTHAHA